MSFFDLQKALELASKCKYYTTAGGKTESDILKAEQLLNIKFSPQCIEFYKKCGYLSFYGNEIFGIDPNDDFKILEGNSIAYALNDRRKYGLPQQWIPIYNYDDGNMAYLDYSNVNSEKEPKVIMAFYDGKHFQVIRELAEDLGEFILKLVQQ